MNQALESKLHSLKLSGMAEALTVRNQEAMANQLAYTDFLELLLERGEKLTVREVRNKVTGQVWKGSGGQEPVEVTTGYDGNDGQLDLKPVGAARSRTVTGAEVSSVPVSR